MRKLIDCFQKISLLHVFFSIYAFILMNKPTDWLIYLL